MNITSSKLNELVQNYVDCCDALSDYFAVNYMA